MLIFTVPYWASSQPIEQVRTYVKCYVVWTGRKMVQLRSQIICGMYGLDRVGDIAKCWKEPEGLAAHTGVTPELTCKFINHSHKSINEFILNNRYIKHMGCVGHWSDRDIERLVLPTAGSMDQDELTEIGEVDGVPTESDILEEVDV